MIRLLAIIVGGGLLSSCIPLYSLQTPFNKIFTRSVIESSCSLELIELNTKHLNPTELIALRRAQLTWEINTRRKLFRENVSEFSYTVVATSSYNQNYIGLYEPTPRRITYRADQTKLMCSILTHELGHSLGLMHTPSTNSVMYDMVSYNNPNPISSDFEFIQKQCQ